MSSYRCIYKLVGSEMTYHLRVDAQDVPEAIEHFEYQLKRQSDILSSLVAVVPEKFLNSRCGCSFD